MAAAAGGEADIGLPAKRALDEQEVAVNWLAQRLARLARFHEGRRLRAEPDVLPLDHVSWSCLSSRCTRPGGRETRRSSSWCPATQRVSVVSISSEIEPRTDASASASANNAPELRADSRHGSQRQAKLVAEGLSQTVVMRPPPGRRTSR